MPLPSYPSRGAWRFRNVTQGFDFWPMLDSLGVSQEDFDDLSVLSASVNDPDASLTFSNEDKCWGSFRGTRIWAGHLRVLNKDQISEVGPRVWVLEGQDFTAKLEDSVITARRHRKREKAKRRIRWIMSWCRFDFDLDLANVPDVYVEKYDYFGNTVMEALDAVCEDANLHYRADFASDEDPDPTLHVFRQEADDAPFALDNESPDFVTTFPFREFSQPNDSTEMANAVLVIPEKRHEAVWRKDTDSISIYGRQERSISDSALKTRQAARNTGDRSLAQTSEPSEEGSCVVHEPGLYAGMRVDFHDALWEHNQTYYIDHVDIEPLDPHDESGEAYLKTTIHFIRRRRKHRRHRQTTNRMARKRHGPNADTKQYVVDAFNDRTIPAPTHSDYGATGMSFTGQCYRAGVSDLYGTEQAWQTTGGITAGSWVGWTWLVYTDPANQCSGFWPQYVGWEEREMVFHATVPAYPTDAAGIMLSIDAAEPVLGLGWDAGGVADQYGMIVRIGSSLPTGLRQGSNVGVVAVPSSGGQVFIPVESLPSAGSTLYVTIAPNWICQRSVGLESSTVHACQYQNPSWHGEFTSGRANVGISAARWHTWDGDDDTIGTAPGDADAPWGDTSWPWVKVGEEGAATNEVTGGCLRITGGGAGWALLGPREDEDAEWGPWSDFDCAPRVRFSIDEAGDVSEAGTRHLELTIIGQGEKAVVRVHFGDGYRAAGIEALGPGGSDYVAKTVDANTDYRVLMDTRCGQHVHAKMWEHGTLMPTEWDVTADLEETEDDGDRFELWGRVTSDSGTMTLSVCQLAFATFASPGERVVRELIGYADHTTTSFPTSHQYQRGTIRVDLDGFVHPPATEQPSAARFKTDRRPARRVPVRATYTAD